MKRDILEKLGVTPEKWEEFRVEYWADVNNVVRRKLKKREQQQTDEAMEDFKSAILSMLKLINDPVRLQKILAAVNREYYKMGFELDADRERVQSERGVSDCQ